MGCWKNGTDRLAQCRVATNLQFAKDAKSAKHNKTRYGCNKQKCQRNGGGVKTLISSEAITLISFVDDPLQHFK